jgi:CheY-like chemotaxis protein
MTDAPIGILLADDSEDDVLLLRTAFEKSPRLELRDAVRDGDEALAYLRRQGPYAAAKKPDLVILDVNMPRVDGFTVLEKIKADPELRRLPVVMLTTSRRDEDVSRAYREGAATYIPKPVGLGDLETFVKRFEEYWAGVAKLPEAA